MDGRDEEEVTAIVQCNNLASLKVYQKKESTDSRTCLPDICDKLGIVWLRWEH